MQSSNTIHINPNFLNQCNGERQHIHINPSFVQGFDSKISHHQFKESFTAINDAANVDKHENCKNIQSSYMPLDFNSECFHYANSALPSTLIVPRPATISVKSFPVEMEAKSPSTLPAINVLSSSANLSNRTGITTKFCGEDVVPLSVSASQMYLRSSKYKLDRKKTTKYNLINNYANWSIQPKTTSNLNSIKTLNHDSKASFLVKDAHYDNEFQLKSKASLPEHLQIQNYTWPVGPYKNKYAINRVANSTAKASKTFKCDTKLNMTSDIAVLPLNGRLEATTLKLPSDNSLIKTEKVVELKTLQSSNVSSLKVNNSKTLINNSFSKGQPTFQKCSRPTFQSDNALVTLGRGKIIKHVNNSRYRLILNSDTKFISQSDKLTEADDLPSSSKPTFSSSNFALKSRTKLIRERSASSIYYQNLKKNTNSSDSWYPCDQNSKTASSMIEQTKSVKKGTLLKARQNLVLKKLKKFHTSRYSFHSNKYKICRPDKLKMDIVKKYVIKRKCNVSNFKKEKDAKVNRQPIQSSSFTQNKAKGDLISKYKITRHRPNQNSGKLQQCVHNDLVSRYKINRKAHLTSKKLLTCNISKKLSYSAMRRRSLHRPKSEIFVNIGGAMFKSTRTSLKKHCTTKNKNDSDNFSRFFKASSGLNNSRFKLNKSQSLVKSLCVSKPGMLTEIVRLQKLGLFKKRNEFCMFYTRFGKCRRKEDGICPFVHDPDKIAICTRFLRGSCKVAECPFSHKLDKSKMPVCSHFLNGTCHKDDCLYRHVNVNPKAPVCRNFLQGHCPHGEECKKKHILICEDFQSTGKCSLGAQCPLSHRMEKNRAKSVSQTTGRKRQNSFASITPGNVKSKRRISGKVGVLGMLKFKQGEVNLLKKKSKTSGKRYFEPKNLEYCENINREELHAENHVPLHQVNELNSSNYIFELKKKRLLKKVEKMKSLYSVGLENDVNNKVASCDSIDSHCNSAIEKNMHDHLDGDVDFSLWRIPLPEVLPSFIPLVMPRLDGNT